MNIRIIKNPEPRFGRKYLPEYDVKEAAAIAPGQRFVRIVRSKLAEPVTPPIYGERGSSSQDKDSKLIIAGYASTWGSVDNTDRHDEFFEPGAFSNEAIKEFMSKTPIILLNHIQSVESVAGRFTLMRTDRRGLYVEGEISSADGMKDVRTKIFEKSVNALSVGGYWFYRPDGQAIHNASLLEVSIVAVPANSSSLFWVK